MYDLSFDTRDLTFGTPYAYYYCTSREEILKAETPINFLADSAPVAFPIVTVPTKNLFAFHR